MFAQPPATAGEPFIVFELGLADRLADLRPAAVLKHAEGEVASVASAVDVPERREPHGASSWGQVAGEEVAGDVVGLERHGASQQRDIDLLPLAGPLSMQQRSQDAEGGHHAAHLVGDGRADARRGAVAVAGDG